ncbi:MAG: hypothetical protein Kow0031_41850 [Anaerolineae bacterium]
MLDTDAVTAGEILRQLPAAAVELPRFGLAEAADRQLPQVAGPAADGLIYPSPGPAPEDLPSAGNFAARYQALAGVPPSPRAALAYDAAQILLDSIEKTIQMDRKWYNNSPSREKVSSALHTITYIGNSGSIAFDQQGRRISPPTWLYQISFSAYPGSGVAP